MGFTKKQQIPVQDEVHPWMDASNSARHVHVANSKFDVVVEEVELLDDPATLRYRVRVGSLVFHPTIIYHSIPHWEFVNDATTKSRLLGAVVAWDAMRFLALGGERLILPADLVLTLQVANVWRSCFLKQFGEWRFRNQIRYDDPLLPLVEGHTLQSDNFLQLSKTEPSLENERWLLTNGGGKDTLAGMLLLNEMGVPYDLFEGCLPFGGEIELQNGLLRNLGTTTAPHSQTISVTIEDDFFDRPMSEFQDAGIEVDYFKTDFFLGHTANYAGFFPIVMFHGYTRMWFNIERSADEVNAIWNGEPIRHQWCKSSEYQQLMTSLYSEIIGTDTFAGFGSTLLGLYDTMIYQIVTQEPDLLLKTHSCNYGKPWCARCPKCCFCYLMMSAFLGESYAMKVLSVDASLLTLDELQPVWEMLLAPDSVAWECVASKEECALALGKYAQQEPVPLLLQKYVPDSSTLLQLERQFAAINWDAIPSVLRPALRQLAG